MLARRAALRYDEESLALAGALLEQNPEVYTAWNFRREALQAALKVRCLGCCVKPEASEKRAVVACIQAGLPVLVVACTEARLPVVCRETAV